VNSGTLPFTTTDASPLYGGICSANVSTLFAWVCSAARLAALHNISVDMQMHNDVKSWMHILFAMLDFLIMGVLSLINKYYNMAARLYFTL
jgi:hypothetical protein